MTFPYDTTHLINHIRSSYISSLDDDIYSTRIMKPYHPDTREIPHGFGQVFARINEDGMNKYGDSFVMSESPPIQFDILENFKERNKKFEENANVNVFGFKEEENISEEEVSEDGVDVGVENLSINSINTNSTITAPATDSKADLKYTKTLRKSYKPKTIARIFRNNHNNNNNSNSDTSKTNELSDSEDDEDLEDMILEPPDEINESQSTVLQEEDFEDNHNIDFDIDYDDIDSISDFSDINSSLGSSLIDSDSFDEDDTDFSEFLSGSQGGQPQSQSQTNSQGQVKFTHKLKKKKLKHSFSRGSSNNDKKLKKIGSGSASSLRIIKSIKNQQDSTIIPNSGKVPDNITKITDIPKPNLRSNLSELIKEKFSTKKDPLEYYLFALNDGDSSKLINLKIYIPESDTPSSPIMTLKIRNDIAVFDALGFILYNYNKKENLSLELQNPNRWRLELVDEDGENYGDFGILERTRVLSSYGSVEVALCKVSETEYKKNENITPLPFQFNDEVEDDNFANGNNHNDIIELKIFDYPYNALAFNYTSYFISIQSTILDVLKKICQEKKSNYKNFALRDVGSSFVLNNQQILYDLYTNNLEFIPIDVITESNIKPRLNINGSLNTLATNMTPRNINLSTTPPRKQLLNRQSRQFNNQNFNKQQSRLSKATSKYFNDMLNQNPDQVPNTTVYLNWTVWRKKSSFINKQEKSLAIDGDYVHLTPSNNLKWDEHSKTTTFHINQIARIKHYKKIPTQFKIVINKTNGLKRYDLEAKSSKEAVEIVNKLRSIVSAYRMNSYGH